jgi:hypothetical protein
VKPLIRVSDVLVSYLQQALDKLLQEKEFDEISIQDIAGAATVNRATFYDNYTDKFQLLGCMVGCRFHELLTERQVHFVGQLQLGIASDRARGMRLLDPDAKDELQAAIGTAHGFGDHHCGAGNSPFRAKKAFARERDCARNDGGVGKLGNLRCGQGMGTDAQSMLVGGDRGHSGDSRFADPSNARP